MRIAATIIWQIVYLNGIRVHQYILAVTLSMGSIAHADEFWLQPTALPLAVQNAVSLYENESLSDPFEAVRIEDRPGELGALFASLDQRIPPIHTYAYGLAPEQAVDATDPAPDKESGSAESRMIQFIRRYESGSRGYDSVWYGNRYPLPQRPTEMTLCQIKDWQLQARRYQASTAIGMYQLVGGTFRSMIEELGMDCSLKFNQRIQDRIGLALLNRRGWLEFKAGKLSVIDFAHELAGEWAAFPASKGPDRGKSRYWRVAGNRHGIELDAYLAFLTDLRENLNDIGAEAPDVVVAAEERADPALEAAVAESEQPPPVKLMIRSFSR